MRWANDWPIVGANADDSGVGEPVLTYRKPNAGGVFPVTTPPDSDEFNDSGLGLQWQWQANPQSNWAFPSAAYGVLRLLTVPLPNDARNLWDVPNLLLQKFPAPAFTVTTKLTFTARNDYERSGLIVVGLDYSYLSVQKKPDGIYISQTVCQNADKGSPEKETAGIKLDGNIFWLRVKIQENALCAFSFSTDAKTFIPLGQPFNAHQGRWIGAKVGIFAVGKGNVSEMGHADFDWFRVE